MINLQILQVQKVSLHHMATVKVGADIFHFFKYNIVLQTCASVLLPKGVVMLDRRTGVWLSHSTPRFPKYRNKNFWPDSGSVNGQTFMCVTYSYNTFKDIGRWMLVTFMKVILPSNKRLDFDSQDCSWSTSILIHMILTSQQPSPMSCDVLNSEINASQRRNRGFVCRRWLHGTDANSPALQNTHVLGTVSGLNKPIKC